MSKTIILWIFWFCVVVVVGFVGLRCHTTRFSRLLTGSFPHVEERIALTAATSTFIPCFHVSTRGLYEICTICMNLIHIVRWNSLVGFHIAPRTLAAAVAAAISIATAASVQQPRWTRARNFCIQLAFVFFRATNSPFRYVFAVWASAQLRYCFIFPFVHSSNQSRWEQRRQSKQTNWEQKKVQ